MVGVGSLVSVGGSGGGSGGGSSSGIQSINGATGPAITFSASGDVRISRVNNTIIIGSQQSGVIGVNGINVFRSGGDFVVDGASISGLITNDGSGLNAINGDTGPNIDLIGVNGVTVTAAGGGNILLDVSSLSGALSDQADGSGINAINGATGPNIDLLGVSGIRIIPSGNSIIISGEGNDGGGGGDGSGINAINGDTGPNIEIKGVNGVDVSNPTPGCILVDAGSVSGLTDRKFAASFSPTTSGAFNHNLGTRDVLVQIQDVSSPPRWIIPDEIVYDTLDQISVLFNTPQAGRIIIIS